MIDIEKAAEKAKVIICGYAIGQCEEGPGRLMQ